MKAFVAIVYAAILVSLPRSVGAVDGRQWQQPSSTHIVDLVDRYVEEHPNQLGISMAAIVWTAVYEFCR